MAEQFTDDEHAFLRHVRFGELPARILPEDMVETQETEQLMRPIDSINPDEWHLRLGAGY
jgi:hypothetical protein